MKKTRTVSEDAIARIGGSGQNAVYSAKRGTAPALVNGMSPAPIPEDIVVGARFFLTLHTVVGAPGFPKAVNIVLGNPGSFEIQSTSPTDDSVYQYLILLEP
jgi:hypothetical protein